MCSGEHEIKYTTLFNKYLQIYEDTLTDYLKTLDVTIEDFYAEVRQTQDENEDPYLQQFIRCLLASADYESFYRVMYKEGKKAELEQKNPFQADPVAGVAEVKGEAAKADSKEGKGEVNDTELENFDDDFKSEGKSSYK
jgi:hypothetical protein